MPPKIPAGRAWAGLGAPPMEERRGGGSGRQPVGFLGVGAGFRSRPQEIGGLLGVAGGGENRLFVVRQHAQPVGDIGGVIFPDLGGDAQFGAEERAADFGFPFFRRATGIKPATCPLPWRRSGQGARVQPAASRRAIVATCLPWNRAMSNSFSLGGREPSPAVMVDAP